MLNYFSSLLRTVEESVVETFYSIGSEHMILGPAALASFVTLLKIQISGPHLGSTESETLEVGPSNLRVRSLSGNSKTC